jgi:hypothetical protein
MGLHARFLCYRHAWLCSCTPYVGVALGQGEGPPAGVYLYDMFKDDIRTISQKID